MRKRKPTMTVQEILAVLDSDVVERIWVHARLRPGLFFLTPFTVSAKEVREILCRYNERIKMYAEVRDTTLFFGLSDD